MNLDNMFFYFIFFALLILSIVILSVAVAGAFRRSRSLKKIRDWFDKISGNGDGSEFEDFLEVFFSRSGWKVERPTNSTNAPDFGVDLILDGKIAVQAKNYVKDVSNDAIQEVFSGKEYWKNNGFPRLKYAVVVSTSSFTKSAIKQAKATGVILKDGNDIKEALNKGLSKGWIFRTKEDL